MADKAKVECPVCGKFFSKLGINAHVNSCLNLSVRELDSPFDDERDAESLSPPRKVARLASDNIPSTKSEGSTAHSSTSHVSAAAGSSRKPLFQTDSTATSENIAETTRETNYEDAVKNNPAKNSQLLSADDQPSSTVTADSTKNAFNLLFKKSPKCDSPGSSRSSETKPSPQKGSSVGSMQQKDSKTNKPNVQNENANSSKRKFLFSGVQSPSKPKTIQASASSAFSTVPLSKEANNNNSKPSNNPFETGKPIPSSSVTKSKVSHVPLAERMRPLTLSGYVGQEHVLGRNKMLRQLLVSHTIPSMVLWGPPGCGKTTLAKIISARSKEFQDTRFVSLSATTAGIADVKEVVKIAKNELKMLKRKTILFVDEIHRFNKLQQDSFLPHIEDGTIVLIGATTENPSFQVNNALLSRCKVVILEKLSPEHVQTILERAATELEMDIIDDEQDTQGSSIGVMREALKSLALHSDGDARMALNSLQTAIDSKKNHAENPSGNHSGNLITVDEILESLQRSHLQYDRTGEEHYNCASAFQKSIRGSDDSAAIYWMTRMFEGGEDPMFIARRLVVCASEDIGLADPQALPLAVACMQACQLVGRPECGINLAHCTTYLARAPKSNESFAAMSRARENIKQYEGPLPGVPLHLRNAPTTLMKKIGYGAGYKYNHNFKGPVKQSYLPDELGQINFFRSDKT